MKIIRKDIVNMLVKKHNFDEDVAKAFVIDFFEQIAKSLEKGENVELYGFGNFVLLDKKQRFGINPKNGKYAPVSARRVVTFRAGTKLRKIVGNTIPKD